MVIYVHEEVSLAAVVVRGVMFGVVCAAIYLSVTGGWAL
jgi:hypothetical protein